MVSEVDRGLTLDRAALIALCGRAPHRARNLLRWFLRQHGLRAPSAARLAAMLDQLAQAPADARVRLAHAGAEIGFYRGRIVVHAPAVPPFAVAWQGESALALPHGSLEFASCTGAGIAREALEADAVTVRSRAGGERLRPAAGRPRTRVEAPAAGCGMPAWQRESLPLVFCGDVLALVPGIGVDSAFQATAACPGTKSAGIQWDRIARQRRRGKDRRESNDDAGPKVRCSESGWSRGRTASIGWFGRRLDRNSMGIGSMDHVGISR